MFKRVCSLIVAIAMVLMPVTGAIAAPDFKGGLNGDEKIETLKERGFISGYEDGSLKLDQSIKRSEFAKLIVEALGKTGAANEVKGKFKPFSDVELKYWANGIISIAKAATGLNNEVNIIGGYPDGTFKPENYITNAEAIKMLVVLKKADFTKEMAKNAEWPVSWVKWATELGIIGEGSDVSSMLDMKAFATRGDVFKMFFNSIEIEKTIENPIEKPIEVKKEDQKEVVKRDENVAKRPSRPHYRPNYPVYPHDPVTPPAPVKDITYVVFNANGGSDTMQTEEVERNTYFVLPENKFTAPAGQEFDAWSVNDDKLSPGSKIYVTGVTLVKALWKNVSPAPSTDYDDSKFESMTVTGQPKLEYTVGDVLDLSGLKVTLADEDGNTKEVSFADFGKYGITVEPANGTELNKAQDGTKVTVTKNGKTAETNSLTVKEGTTPEPTKIKVTFVYGYENKQDEVVEVGSDNKVSAPEEPTREGFTFEGWYENANFEGDAFNFDTVITADKTLYAKWTLVTPAPEKYTVTVTKAENGSVKAEPATDVEDGTTVTLIVTPAEGYELDTLTVTYGTETIDAKATKTFTMPASNVTVTATFKKTEDQVKKEFEEAVAAAMKTLGEKANEEGIKLEYNSKHATITLPADMDNFEAFGFGTITLLKGLVKNDGLVSYKINEEEITIPEEEDELVTAQKIAKEFAKAAKLEFTEEDYSLDKINDTVKKILAELVKTGDTVNAEVKIKSGNTDTTDTYSVNFVQAPKTEDQVKKEFEEAVAAAVKTLGEKANEEGIKLEYNSKHATITLPADMDNFEAFGFGAVTLLKGLVENEGLVSYKINEEEITITKDEDEVAIAQKIAKEFARAAGLTLTEEEYAIEKLNDTVKKILAKLVETDKKVEADVKVKSGNTETTDNYAVTFVKALTEAQVQVIKDELKKELNTAVKNTLNEVSKNIGAAQLVFNKENNKLFLALPDDITKVNTSNTGVVSAIIDMIKNQGLKSYKINLDGYQERVLVDSEGKALDASDIAQFIIEDLMKFTGLDRVEAVTMFAVQDNSSEIERIVTALKGKNIQATLKTSKTVEGNVIENEDVYMLSITNGMSTNDVEAIENAFTKNMEETIRDVHKNATVRTFHATYENKNYILRIVPSQLKKGGLFGLKGTGFKTAMVNFITGRPVNHPPIQKNLKKVVIHSLGKEVHLDEEQLTGIINVTKWDMVTKLKPFTAAFLKEGKSATSFVFGDLVGQKCTIDFIYVDETTNESYTQTRTMKFEEYKGNN